MRNCFEPEDGKMGKRETKAAEVLAAGGYFRKALERTYMGEKFCTRLYTAGGAVVPGVGFATHMALLEAGKLRMRPCEKSSVWPTEWVLAA